MSIAVPDPAFAEKKFAWSADRVFDGRRVLPAHAVVMENGRITGILPKASVPASLPIFYERDTTILPGLLDTHVHFMRWEAPLFLAYGVTTIRDVGNDLVWILDQQRRAKGCACPGILCVGPILDGPEPSHRVVSRACSDLGDAVAAVREIAEAGVHGVKLYHNLPVEWLPSMVQEAHAFGLKASMHCLQTGVLAAGQAGVDEFFHLDGILTDVWPNHPSGWLDVWGVPAFEETLDAQRQVADEIAELGMTATPTLAYWQSQWRTRAADSEARHVPPEMIAWQGRAGKTPAEVDLWRRALDAAIRFTGFLLRRDVPILPGTDVPFGALCPGQSLWRELSLLAQAGMPALRALQAATSDAADFLGRPLLGRLVSGAVADLAVVRGDPTQRIPEDPDMVAIVHDGAIHYPSELFVQARKAARTVTEDPWWVQFCIHSAACDEQAGSE